MRKSIISISLLLFAFQFSLLDLGGQENFGLVESIILIEDSTFDELLLDSHEIDPDLNYEMLTAVMLDKLEVRSREDNFRIDEHQKHALNFQNKTMHYSFDKIGNAPSQGYPLYIALHGGGNAQKNVNDSQWDAMKSYYRDSINEGIYIAPRGISDSWNLHFMDESYPLYEQLIENMILFENVDPNRIYLLGFSAGGDAVYQIPSRMPDRWAGANMSAGHSNGINLINFRNIPLLIQMGQNDASYNRNHNSVENFIKLNDLQAKYEGYPHEIFVHSKGSHNSWRDNSSWGFSQYILKNPIQWHQTGSSETIQKNTNAIHWLQNHQRNPYPQKLVWDTNTTTPAKVNKKVDYLISENAKAKIGSGHRLFYWLDLNDNPPSKNLGQVIATFDRSLNRINIEEINDGVNISILVNTSMVDFSKPINIFVRENEIGFVYATPSLEVMARTLLERGDPNFVFKAEIKLRADESGNWSF